MISLPGAAVATLGSTSAAATPEPPLRSTVAAATLADQPQPQRSDSGNPPEETVAAVGLHVDGVLFDSLVESVAPLLCDLSQEQMQNFVLHSCAKQLQGGGDIDPDKIANAVFSIDHDSAEWQARLRPPAGITVLREQGAQLRGQDLRVMQVTVGRPSRLQCCSPRQVTHTFTFDAGSSKVLSEVDRCIRSVVDASMQYMSTDKQVPYLLLTAAGDVVVLTKELLHACPSASPAVYASMARGPASTAAAQAFPVPTRGGNTTPRLFLVRKGKERT